MEGFTPKLPEELDNQTESVSRLLGQEIVQPSKKEEIQQISLEEIKDKFPDRYEIYLKILRAQKNGIDISEEDSAEMKEWIGALNNLDTYIESHRKNEEERTLRERQVTVFEDIRDFLEEGGKEGYIKLPTGSGKTVIFSEVIEAMGLKTLIAVPTRILVNQTTERLSEFAQDIDVGQIYSHATQYGEDVTVITYSSLVTNIANETLNPDEYKLLILDEAHTGLSEKRIHAIKQFDKAIKLGFTATPIYSEEKNVGNLLTKEIHTLSIKEAVHEGMLSSFSVILAETDVDLTSVEVRSGGDYSPAQLEKLINIESRNRSAVELYQKMFMGESAIAYCNSIEHSQKVAKLFNDVGIKAEWVSGINNNMSSKQQEGILARFHSGEIDVLCNADILIAGFDEPRASVCLNLRPTHSPVIAEQRGGRVLRLDPSNLSKHATIVDFIDKNNNKKNQPITFAEIAEASVLYPATSSGKADDNSENSVRETRHRPSIEISGLKVTTEANEVMKIVSGMISEKIKPAPEGWYMAEDVARTIGASSETVAKLANQYKQSNPEWFGIYTDSEGKGKPSQYYSPELIDVLAQSFNKVVKAPAGWMTVAALGKDMDISSEPILKIVDKYKDTKPEWFKKYRDAANNEQRHLSPELVKIIRESRDVPEAPEGWMTPYKSTEFLKMGKPVIIKLVEPFRATNPEWFKVFKDNVGRVVEHYSPELLEKIKSVSLSAPEGWMSARAIGTFLTAGERTVKKMAEAYRKSNPEWFGVYRSKTGPRGEFYSPELVEKISQSFNEVSKAPAGWLTIEAISRIYNLNKKNLRTNSNKYRDEHPEWFKNYKNERGFEFEHLSPELIEELRK